MYKQTTYISFLLATAAIFVLGSCTQKDYSKEVHQIDSLLVQLNEVTAPYAQLDFARLGAQVDSVNTHLDYVQKNFVGFQRDDMAKVMGDYRRVKKLIPDIASAHPKIMEEIRIDQEQLIQLKNALVEKATHDAAGNKITDEYVEKAFNMETKAASDLIQQLRQLMDRVPLADSIYNANYAKVRFWVDSIPAIPTPLLPVPK